MHKVDANDYSLPAAEDFIYSDDQPTSRGRAISSSSPPHDYYQVILDDIHFFLLKLHSNIPKRLSFSCFGCSACKLAPVAL